jgi:hypothetical protein
MSNHPGPKKAEESNSAASHVEHEGVVAEAVRSTWSSEAASTTVAAMNKLLGFATKQTQNKLETIPISNLPELAKGSPPPAKDKRDK